MKSKFGVDVASTRADDLDKMLLEEIRWLRNPKVLDIACGAGGQSARMVMVGAEVYAIDIEDYRNEFDALNLEHDFKRKQLVFLKKDALSAIKNFADKEFDLVCMQRMIHYLPYAEASELLHDLKRVVKSKLYVSVSGLTSEIGRTYKDKDLLVSERFSKLSETDSSVFSISEPVCLYTKDEFILLLRDAGWEVEEVWTSAFGNHKAVCSKR